MPLQMEQLWYLQRLQVPEDASPGQTFCIGDNRYTYPSSAVPLGLIHVAACPENTISVSLCKYSRQVRINGTSALVNIPRSACCGDVLRLNKTDLDPRQHSSPNLANTEQTNSGCDCCSSSSRDPQDQRTQATFNAVCVPVPCWARGDKQTAAGLWAKCPPVVEYDLVPNQSGECMLVAVPSGHEGLKFLWEKRQISIKPHECAGGAPDQNVATTTCEAQITTSTGVCTVQFPLEATPGDVLGYREVDCMDPLNQSFRSIITFVPLISQARGSQETTNTSTLLPETLPLHHSQTECDGATVARSSKRSLESVDNVTTTAHRKKARADSHLVVASEETANASLSALYKHRKPCA